MEIEELKEMYDVTRMQNVVEIKNKKLWSPNVHVECMFRIVLKGQYVNMYCQKSIVETLGTE